MREIKFRAWDTYDNKMKYKFTIGSVTNSDDDLWTCPTIWVEDTGWVNCDTLTLMQFTGLFDKQCVEIYEGDIVKVCGERLFEVVFTDGCFNLKANNKEFVLAIAVQNSQVNECDLHVIGNRFENHELLENK